MTFRTRSVTQITIDALKLTFSAKGWARICGLSLAGSKRHFREGVPVKLLEQFAAAYFTEIDRQRAEQDRVGEQLIAQINTLKGAMKKHEKIPPALSHPWAVRRYFRGPVSDVGDGVHFHGERALPMVDDLPPDERG